jgi:hypothetical protein
VLGLDQTATRIVQIGAIVVVLCFCLAAFTMCNKPSARNEAKVARSVGKQLDRVAAETPVIRQEQEEKQREASQIEGADTPLPDGFGPSLERVRRGGKHSDSR